MFDLIMTLLYMACVMDSEMPYFLIWSLIHVHQAPGAVYCISLSCLCPFYAIPICNPNTLSEIFHLLVYSYYLVEGCLNFLVCLGQRSVDTRVTLQ